MKHIENSFYSYVCEYSKPADKTFSTPEGKWKFKTTDIEALRQSEIFPVKRYSDLLTYAARLTKNVYYHKIFFLPFAADYFDNKGRTEIFPSICRPNDLLGKSKSTIKTPEIVNRYNNLSHIINKLYSTTSLVNDNLKAAMMAMEHYKLFPTPFIEVFESLHIAASLGLHDNPQSALYLLSLPFVAGPETKCEDLGIMMYRVGNYLSEEAKRPLYRDSYMVTSMPFEPEKTKNNNFAGRMVAKFQLDNSDGNFWDELGPFPSEKLFFLEEKYASELAEAVDKVVKELNRPAALV